MITKGSVRHNAQQHLQSAGLEGIAAEVESNGREITLRFVRVLSEHEFLTNDTMEHAGKRIGEVVRILSAERDRPVPAGSEGSG